MKKLNALRQDVEHYKRRVRREILLRIEREDEIKKLRLENARLGTLVDARFTENEKVILRNLSDKYCWIARDKSDKLYVYTSKPTKDNQYWLSVNMRNLNAFKHLFKSIQWSDDEPCEFRRYI